MVSKFLPVLLLASCILGCSGGEEKSTQRAVPLTVDQQIAEIEKRTDMPDAIKQQTIAGLRQQAEAQKNRPPSK